MITIWFILLLAAVTVGAECPQRDLYYRGNKIGKRIKDIASWELCSDRCKAVKDCHAWSWRSDTYKIRKKRLNCYLKNSNYAAASKHSAGTLSGTRQCGKANNQHQHGEGGKCDYKRKALQLKNNNIATDLRNKGCLANDTCKKALEKTDPDGTLEKAVEGVSSMSELTSDILETTKEPKTAPTLARNGGAAQRKLKLTGMSKFSKALGKITRGLGPFLGALGPIASLFGSLFGQQSAEELAIVDLKKETIKQFNIVNQKFAKVLLGQNELKEVLIRLYLKNTINPMLEEIKRGQDVVEKLFNSNTPEAIVLYRSDLKKEGVKFLEALYKLENLLLDEDAVNGGLIKHLMLAWGENRKAVQRRLMECFNALLKGAEVYLFYFHIEVEVGKNLDLVFNHKTEEIRTCHRMTMLTKVLNKISEMDSKNFVEDWRSKFVSDLDRKMSNAIGGLENQAAANELYKFFAGKYDFRDWYVFVYDYPSTDNDAVMKVRCKETTFKKEFPIQKKTVILVHTESGLVANADDVRKLKQRRKENNLRCKGTDNGCCEPPYRGDPQYRQGSPCGHGDGDCDSDRACEGSLKCGNNNCPWGDADDCCYDPTEGKNSDGDGRGKADYLSSNARIAYSYLRMDWRHTCDKFVFVGYARVDKLHVGTAADRKMKERQDNRGDSYIMDFYVI